MPSISPPLLNMTWSLWKANWRDVVATATVAAGLEAGAFSLFLYMFVQDLNRVLPVVAGGLLIFWFFHLGVSALHAHLISRSATASVAHGEAHDKNHPGPYQRQRDGRPGCVGPAINAAPHSLERDQAERSLTAIEHAETFCANEGIAFRHTPGITSAVTAEIIEETDHAESRLLAHARQFN